MEGHRFEIPDLASFIISDVQPTGRELGKGAYGSVEEVEIPGAICAAKKIHTELLNIGNRDGIMHIMSKFASECRLMSNLRHPHVVQFLGVSYLPGAKLPSLVMECLETDLHDLLETTPCLPLTVKKLILLNTAQGLLYLHSLSPPIIHRDLTARNVLLNSAMVAKIADLGVARIINCQPNRLGTMTQGPGNIVYMPPEAIGVHTQYNTSLDIFSFGNIALFTLTQEFIGPKLKAATYVDRVGKLKARSEIERREDSFFILYRDLKDENTLVWLIRDCLQNHPTDRPCTTDVVETIKKVSSNIEPPSTLKLTKQLSSKERVIKQMADTNKHLKGEWLLLQEQSSVQQQEIEKKDTQLMELREIVFKQEKQIQDIEKKLADMFMQGSISSKEMNQLQTEIDKMKDDLVFPLTFKWEKQSNFNFEETIESLCIVNGQVYANLTDTPHLLEYIPATDTWVKLPTPTKGHGLVSLNRKLTLVGGLTKESGQYSIIYSPVIRVWDSDSMHWKKSYPSMLRGRQKLGCTSYQQYLIVAGGIVESKVQTATSVEILDTRSGQWYKAPPMMYNGWGIRSLIIGQSLYLSFKFRGIATSSKSLLRVSLPTLITHTLQGKNHDTSIWEKMPDMPLYQATLFSIGNMLLTAGGTHGGTVSILAAAAHLRKEKPSADINIFNPHTNQWLKIGEVPESRMTCGCIVLPSGKLLVAGGEGTISGSTPTVVASVYTATIAGSYFEPSPRVH